MTIEFDCKRGDYSSAENLISRFLVTTTKGIAVSDLYMAELAEVRQMFNLHTHTHPGHSCTTSFHIPKGYEVRDPDEAIIYKKG